MKDIKSERDECRVRRQSVRIDAHKEKSFVGLSFKVYLLVAFFLFLSFIPNLVCFLLTFFRFFYILFFLSFYIVAFFILSFSFHIITFFAVLLNVTSFFPVSFTYFAFLLFTYSHFFSFCIFSISFLSFEC